MTAIMIFGASRNVGMHLARILRERETSVYACLRSPQAQSALEALGVQVRTGDAFDGESLEKAMRGLPEGTGLVSTLSGYQNGAYADSTGNINLIGAAARAGIGRFTLITSIGCGDMDPYVSDRARKAFGHVVAEKTKAEDFLKASGLDYTIIRPGGLTDKPATGNGILVQEPAMHGMITREDVALLTADALASPKARNQIFACVDRDEARCEHPFTPFSL